MASEAMVNSKTIVEVRDLALELIRTFGERSTAYANHQALKARQRGDRMHVLVGQFVEHPRGRLRQPPARIIERVGLDRADALRRPVLDR